MKQKLNMKQLRPAARSAVMGLYGRIGRLTQQLKKALAWSDKIEQRFHDQRQRLITTQYARDLALGSASAAGAEKEHWKERAKRAEAELVGKRIAAAGEAGALEQFSGMSPGIQNNNRKPTTMRPDETDTTNGTDATPETGAEPTPETEAAADSAPEGGE